MAFFFTVTLFPRLPFSTSRPAPSWIVSLVNLALRSVSAATVGIPAFTIIPAATAVVPTARHSSRNSGLTSADWPPYVHVIFTVLTELNSLIYANQKLLYTLLHCCCAETLLTLAANKKYLGAPPGIIQVLHTWGQELNFHPHIYCIVSGGGLIKCFTLKNASVNFSSQLRHLKKYSGLNY